MATGMIEIMKIAAMEAIDNAKPCDVRFGTVSSVSPLSVRISSDLILPESVLVVPQHLTDYTVNVNIGLIANDSADDEVEEGDIIEDVDESITEGIDERTLTIYNALEVGDNVVLLRNQGGKQYLILDRV